VVLAPWVPGPPPLAHGPWVRLPGPWDPVPSPPDSPRPAASGPLAPGHRPSAPAPPLAAQPPDTGPRPPILCGLTDGWRSAADLRMEGIEPSAKAALMPNPLVILESARSKISLELCGAAPASFLGLRFAALLSRLLT
jgi:hypothetical protein